MKTLKISILALLFSLAIPTQAQTVEEIIANYFENTGGIENWKSLKSLKSIGKGIQQGQEFPGTMIQLKSGKQMQSYSIQGKELKQGVFDGETLWSTNFLTMKAEKSDAEQTANFKLNTNDFPDPFLVYKEKGYTVELLGKETIDGAETFKVKLVKEPITVDGKQEEDVSLYFFDTENFVPIAMETELKSGPAKGQTIKVTMSDYQEVDGLYFSFSTSQYIGEQVILTLEMDSIELNPEIDETIFAYPESTVSEKK